MLEILRFVLGDFWHFAGTVVLIAVTLNGFAEIVTALRPPPKP